MGLMLLFESNKKYKKIEIKKNKIETYLTKIIPIKNYSL